MQRVLQRGVNAERVRLGARTYMKDCKISERRQMQRENSRKTVTHNKLLELPLKDLTLQQENLIDVAFISS